jgi:amidase
MLFDHYAKCIETHNPGMNAIAVQQLEKARVRVKDADAARSREESWGPLHRLPMTVKESFDVEGLPTTFGDADFAQNIARRHATAVERLLGAGAIIMGKTNVPFMLADHQTANDLYGTTNNSRDTDRGPGGSSGGAAAALAAGLTGLELGSDVGGSVRVPAHVCGIYGHKSTARIVPFDGHALPGRSTTPDMGAIGPLARSAEDLALALGVVSGADGCQSTAWRLELPAARATRLKNFRVAAWRESSLCSLDPAAAKVLDAAIDGLRYKVATFSDRHRPDYDEKEAHRAFLALLYRTTIGGTRLPDEEFHRRHRAAEDLEEYDFSFLTRSLSGPTLYHSEWHQANATRDRIGPQWRTFFERFDELLAPVPCTPAFLHDRGADRDSRRLHSGGRKVSYIDQIYWSGVATLPHLPATSAPIGLTAEGLPVGLQIIGREGADLTTIAFATALAEEMGGFVSPPFH